MPLHVYSLREHRDRRSISKYKKNNVQQSNSQHKLNRGKHKKKSTKKRSKRKKKANLPEGKWSFELIAFVEI